jgi:selenophosphate synthetase-related protein
MIDEMLKDWPQHSQVKRIMSDAERLAMFADARRRIASECVSGKDFAAGVALGEDLAMYKMALIEDDEQLKSPPQQ